MQEEVKSEIQCPCGHYIDVSSYKLLYLKKELREIDILCPNNVCYLSEVGFIKFSINEKGKPEFKRARFYSPYVTWNATQLGEEKVRKILKEHLRQIVLEKINWSKIVEDTKDLSSYKTEQAEQDRQITESQKQEPIANDNK